MLPVKCNPVTTHCVCPLENYVTETYNNILTSERADSGAVVHLNRAFRGHEFLPRLWKWPDFKTSFMSKFNITGYK